MKNISSLLTLTSIFCFCACSNKKIPTKEIPTTHLNDHNIHTTLQQKYLDSSDHSKVPTEATGKATLDKPNPITFEISNYNEKASNYKVYYSYKYDYNDTKINNESYVIPNGKDVSITNLEQGKTYYFKVTANDEAVEQGTFNTESGIIRNLEVDGMKNFRDMGGYTTDLGHFKSNMIFRTSELNDTNSAPADSYITDKGAKTMINDLKIKTEIDLRRIDENIPTEYKTESILKVKYGANVKLFQLDINHVGFNILVGDGRKQKIKDFFNKISDINNYPICFHCHIGTDRTGMFAAAIHSLLGGSKEHIYRDYMFSNFANIGNPRNESGINTSFMNALNNRAEQTIAEKAYNLLTKEVGIPNTQLDSIRNILLD